jgi:hypothetical protein
VGFLRDHPLPPPDSGGESCGPTVNSTSYLTVATSYSGYLRSGYFRVQAGRADRRCCGPRLLIGNHAHRGRMLARRRSYVVLCSPIDISSSRCACCGDAPRVQSAPEGRNNLAHRNAVGTRFPPHPARMARHPLPEERAVIRIRVPALSPGGGEGGRRSGEGVFVFPGFPIESIGTGLTLGGWRRHRSLMPANGFATLSRAKGPGSCPLNCGDSSRSLP